MRRHRHDPLTCQTALELIDAENGLAPCSEPFEPRLQAAWDHVQACPNCSENLAALRDMDRKIGEAMRSVPIPSGLKEQLLAQTRKPLPAAIGNDSETRLPSESAGKLNLTRRRMSWLALAVLMMMALGGSWWWWQSRPQPISLQELYARTPLEPTQVIEVTDWTRLPPLPMSWLRQPGLRMSKPCWYSPHAHAAGIGWVMFELQPPHQKPTRGVLLLTTASQVLDPPREWSDGWPRVTYSPRDGVPISAASWSECGAVYICLVRGDTTQLERLLRRLAPTTA